MEQLLDKCGDQMGIHRQKLAALLVFLNIELQAISAVFCRFAFFSVLYMGCMQPSQFIHHHPVYFCFNLAVMSSLAQISNDL